LSAKTRRLEVRELYRVVRVSDDEAVLKQVSGDAVPIDASEFWPMQPGAEIRISPPVCDVREGIAFELKHLVREVTPEGLGVAPTVARALRLPEPLVVFVRDDGWSVGAAGDRAERQALDYWGHRYVQFARREEGWTLRPISEYSA
jgi:hypothetical protein